MKSEFLLALTQLAAEKNLSKEVVLSAVEAALTSAFKKEGLGSQSAVSVKVHPTTGRVRLFTTKTVVEEPEDSHSEISLAEAQKIKPDVQLNDVLNVETLVPTNAGRIAAQTARQVVLQRLREQERELVYSEYADKEGDIVSGIVQRVEPKQIIIELGRTEAILPPSEQVRTEHYRRGQRLKVYLLEVQRSTKGPQLIVSRTHRNLVRRLFELEVPEVYNGTVEVKAIAREPGYRSKVAVAARQEGIDPVGSCVGLRGIRIQNIISEIEGEKIDVVQWHSDAALFIANALSPAQVLSVQIDKEEASAVVVVPDRQLSLAIGKDGQNARLAAKLTGWKIDIKAASVAEQEKAALREKEALEEATVQLEEVVAEPAAIEEPLPPVAEEIVPAEAIEEAPVEEKPAEKIALATRHYPESPRIRFAEEILTEAPKLDRKAKKGKKKTTGRKEEGKEFETPTLLKKGRRSWKASLEEDLEEVQD